MNIKNVNNKIIVILGLTASGKSDLAIILAKKYNGEIISSDSRQVYREMDIGTGKVPRDPAQKSKLNKKDFFSEGIRHHLIDVVSPKRSYNITHFIRDAKKAILNIQKRGKLPIICGGAGFWTQALIENSVFPPVKPNIKLRKKLEKYPAEKLFSLLEKKDPRSAKTIDRHNRVRLIRALEIIEALGKIPPLKKNGNKLQELTIQTGKIIIVALVPAKEALRKRIEKRLKERLKQGMVEEVQHLRKTGISWKRLESFGLEYKNIALFLQKKILHQTMRENILRETSHYAKRQLTWLRRFEKMGANIHWISAPQESQKIIKTSLL